MRLPVAILSLLTLFSLSQSLPSKPVDADSLVTTLRAPPIPESVSSCLDWGRVYDQHWQSYPNCHPGISSVQCCELYDLLDKSIRIFSQQLECSVVNIDFFAAKFSAHCTGKGINPDKPGIEGDSPSVKPPVVDEENVVRLVGAGPIQILQDGSSKTTCQPPACPDGCVGSACAVRSGGGCGGGHCNNNCGNCNNNCNNCNNNCKNCNCNNCNNCNNCKHCNNCCKGCGGGGGGGGGGGNKGGGQSPNTIPPRNDGSVCFHRDGVVLLQDGSSKRMSQLVVGDSVHVGNGQFSSIFMFTHQNANVESTFVNLTVASGEHVIITPNHYMYASSGMKAAGEIDIGESMQMDDGRMESVVGKTLFADRGLFNPQTMMGDLAVNGFRASTYTKFIEKETAHSLLMPLRAFYRICGLHISALFH